MTVLHESGRDLRDASVSGSQGLLVRAGSKLFSTGKCSDPTSGQLKCIKTKMYKIENNDNVKQFVWNRYLARFLLSRRKSVTVTVPVPSC